MLTYNAHKKFHTRRHVHSANTKHAHVKYQRCKKLWYHSHLINVELASEALDTDLQYNRWLLKAVTVEAGLTVAALLYHIMC
jgi:hypothetical protein